jgi:hypothetical protein
VLSVKEKVKVIDGLEPGQISAEILNSSVPLVLKGLVKSWPFVQCRSPEESIAYLREFSINKDVVAFKGLPEIQGRFFYNEDLTGFNFERISSGFNELLTILETIGTTEKSSIYLGSTSINECFPGFRKNNDLDLDHMSPVVSIWMGNQSRIAAHFDHPKNIACVAAGRRRFTMFPPGQISNLYVGPLDFTPAGQAISLVDFQHPNFKDYPLFEEALLNSQVAELEAGDAIFIPSMWWHHVEALESLNVLINYWWRSAPAIMGTPIDALIHALLSIKALPKDQKQAWRVLFEHYVFDEESGSISHIPDQSLGILGKLDGVMAKQLRAMLRNNLK